MNSSCNFDDMICAVNGTIGSDFCMETVGGIISSDFSCLADGGFKISETGYQISNPKISVSARER